MPHLKDILDRIGKETVRLIVGEISKQGLIKTGKLRDSISYDVVQTTNGYELEFGMVEYGEFLDKGTKYIQPPREFYEKIIQEQLTKYSDEIAQATIDDMLDGLDI